MIDLRLKLNEVRSNIIRSNLSSKSNTRDNFHFAMRIFLSELKIKLETPILSMSKSPTMRTNMYITRTKTRGGSKGHLIRDHLRYNCRRGLN